MVGWEVWSGKSVMNIWVDDDWLVSGVVGIGVMGVNVNWVECVLLNIVVWVNVSNLVLGLMNHMVGSLIVWVVEVIVILHPFVGVDKLVLVVIISVVVLFWLESVVLPVIRVHSVVIGIGVVIISVRVLQVVWAGMSMEVWDLVVLIDNMSISMSIVVIPSVLWSMMIPRVFWGMVIPRVFWGMMIPSSLVSIRVGISITMVSKSIASVVTNPSVFSWVLLMVSMVCMVLSWSWLMVHSSNNCMVVTVSMISIDTPFTVSIVMLPWHIMSIHSVVAQISNNW